MEKQNSGIGKEEQRTIIALIKALIPETKIYLFGSRARGDFSERSDIDLALDIGEKIEPRCKISEIKDVLEATNMIYHFDVLDIHNVNEELKDRILKEAVEWKN